MGVTIPSLSTYEIPEPDYLLWARPDAITEITPFLVTGSLVVNDGLYDLSSTYGLFHLKYPDTAFNSRFLSDPERVNGFLAKTVQEAIEEAGGGIVSGIPPTTTIGAVTAIAYSETLADNTTGQFEAWVICRRTDVAGDTGDFKLMTRVKRESGGPATLVGALWQSRAIRTDSTLQIDWAVSGNVIQLTVTGAAGKTVKWQPEVERVKVS